ncbi:MAG: orotidine-5'-phosphate decarboxylase [Cryomorphaceae bacterium]|nr:MAG: orotidine-5'-phosphate decarboxylase [Cryomorphaceae bacterium]
MTREQLIKRIKEQRSFLCVGLDSDPALIPVKFKQYKNPVLEFNKAIIELTAPYCVAYKPNTAFYERSGWQGWQTLQETVAYIPEGYLKILDAKRGDIGNTSNQYAAAFWDTVQADALTVAPYMGRDSVEPYLNRKGKWAVVLALTSNQGANDFQMLRLENGDMLFEQVVKSSIQWGSEENLMYVVGATRGDLLSKMRALAPGHFFLVPGVGAQGGSLADVAKHAMTSDCGLLVNASRSVIYAGSGEGFEKSVEDACIQLQRQMETLLLQHNII